MTVKIHDWKEFAKVTIEINDLDTTYVMLYNARKVLGDDYVKRFCIAMLMFYHVGEAAHFARLKDNEFWDAVLKDYVTIRRGRERRHFRGMQGIRSIASLIGQARDASEASDVLQAIPLARASLARHSDSPRRPEDLFDRMVAPSYPLLVQLFAKNWKGFGAYFVWKVLDYQERIFDHQIDVSQCYNYVPDLPRQCAEKLWPGRPLKDVLDEMEDYLKQFPAPPKYDRPCGVQEAETILCMWKTAYFSGFHQVGDEIEDRYNELKQVETCSEVAALISCLPPKQDASQWEIVRE